MKNIILFLKIIRINRVIAIYQFILWYVIITYFYWIQIDLLHLLISIFSYIVAFSLIYQIVYIFNDILDLEKDKQNLQRISHKPLANWTISLNNFLWISIISIWIWLIFSFFIDKLYILVIWVSIIYNFFYSKYLKHVFIIENIANTLTHTFSRFLFGMIIAIIFYKTWFDYKLLTILTLFHLILWTLGFLHKRFIEFNFWQKTSRSTLMKYNDKVFNKLFLFLNFMWLWFIWFYVWYFWFEKPVITYWIMIALIISNIWFFYWYNKISDKIISIIALN